jgi:hypothetical protein
MPRSHIFLASAAVLMFAVGAGDASAKACRDAKGHFTACPASARPAAERQGRAALPQRNRRLRQMRRIADGGCLPRAQPLSPATLGAVGQPVRVQRGCGGSGRRQRSL